MQRVLAALLIGLGVCACSPSVVQNQAAIAPAKSTEAAQVPDSAAAKPEPSLQTSILIDRGDRTLQVLDQRGSRLWQSQIGLGQGGLKVKQDMADLVTPTGEMVVDLILYRKPEYNQIDPTNVDRFSQDPEFRPLVIDQPGLTQLFQTMNRLDFDGDGSPDQAYGDAYIGLTAATVITGPKMTRFEGTPYWFSIALHGTPKLENIGQANSGGCVHVDPQTLQRLIEQGWVKLGTKVTIVD